MTLPYYKPFLSPIARSLRRIWESLAYRGTGVVCPVCERSFRHFVEGPTGRCPGCGAPGRSRLLWIYLRNDRPDLLSGSRSVLQIAPDRGLEPRLRGLSSIRYLSGDLHEPEAMIRLDLTNLDLPDECFDVVICVHVLPHISNDRRAMREILRILRPSGVALIMTPLEGNLEITYEDPCIINPRERDKAFGEWDFVRKYGRDFVDRLKQAGFDVEIVQPADKLDEATQKTYGMWNERIYVCRRAEQKK
jgi:SAM-dependent methyltransferase